MCKLNKNEEYLFSTLMSALSYHTWSGNEKIIQPFLLEKLSELGFEMNMDKIGNIYAVRGMAEQYPLLNAHMDIVYSLSSKAKTLIQNKMNKTKEQEKKSYKDIINCANCSFLEACMECVVKEHDITEQRAYWKLKWSKGCDMYVYDFEGYNKKLYSIFDETYTPEQVERACSYGNYSTTFYYTYISDAEKPEYDKYLQEMYTIKFNEKTGKIEGSEERVLGGDDKCGIALALATAHALPKLPMKILFTTGEEKGCDGINEFCKTNKEWFDDCKFSITIDRRDNDNLLRWSAGKANCSKEFAAQLALFGVLSEIPVKVESGTLADVIHIRNHVKETVNISAGYHNPHSTEEWIDFYAMCDILEWLKRIVQYAKV